MVVRLSMAFSTSSGREMFSMTRLCRGEAEGREGGFQLLFRGGGELVIAVDDVDGRDSRFPNGVGQAGHQDTAQVSGDVGGGIGRKGAENLRMNTSGATTRKANTPKADIRIMPNSLSRMRTGFWVPISDR